MAIDQKELTEALPEVVDFRGRVYRLDRIARPREDDVQVAVLGGTVEGHQFRNGSESDLWGRVVSTLIATLPRDRSYEVADYVVRAMRDRSAVLDRLDEAEDEKHDQWREAQSERQERYGAQLEELAMTLRSFMQKTEGQIGALSGKPAAAAAVGSIVGSVGVCSACGTKYGPIEGASTPCLVCRAKS